VSAIKRYVVSIYHVKGKSSSSTSASAVIRLKCTVDLKSLKTTDKVKWKNA
jgi:hypothetical protein